MSLRFFRLSLVLGLLSVARAAPVAEPSPITGGTSNGPVPSLGPASSRGPTPSFAPEPPVASPAATPPAAVTPAAAAAITPAADGEQVSLKLSDADIDTVLATLEIYTGRTILRPQALPAATYTIKITKPVPKAEAVLALETILSLNGVGIAPLGDKFLKVVALAQVKNEAPEMIEGSTLALPPSGRTATKLFQFEFLRANEIVPQLAPLMSPGVTNGVVVLDKANAALITDSISNLQRVENLLRLLDHPSSAGLTPKFYTLHNGAKASDVVNKLRAMFQGPLQNQLGSATSFSADDRTNQIILLADSRQYPLFDDLIAKLDIKADPNTRNEVIYLKHAASKDVATLLSSLVSGQNAAQKSSDSTRPNQQPPAPGGTSGPPVATPAAMTVATVSLNSTAEGATNFSNLVTILADDRSNAIIVSGTVDDIRLIRDLVDKIDIVLAQVRIEVIIAEVSLSDTDKSGISALNLTVAPNATNGALQITKFSGSISSWDVSAGVVNPLSFEAALTDAGSKHNVRILSAPTIVTTHNKQAQFAVTQQQPVITGTTSTPTTSSTAAQSGFSTNSQVTYKDIGITLKVTPLIGDDGAIQLQVDQVVDDVISNVTIDGNVQPVIGHREANSTINVFDGQMIVLGGLQRNSRINDRNKIGFFWELPIISNIFGAKTNTTERTELLLFIRPHVLRPEENTSETGKKINEMTNKDQVKQFLVDPSKEPKDKLPKTFK